MMIKILRSYLFVSKGRVSLKLGVAQGKTAESAFKNLMSTTKISRGIKTVFAYPLENNTVTQIDV